MDDIKVTNGESYDLEEMKLDKAEVEKSIAENQKLVEEYLSEEYPMLFVNTTLIITKYPKFFKKFGEYLQKLNPEMPLDLQEIELILLTHPKFIIDFLDKEEIYINIEGFKDQWSYLIPKTVIDDIQKYINRPTAEYHAIMHGIKLFEEKV